MRQLCVYVLCGLLAGQTATAQLLKKINPFDSVPTVRVSLVHPPLLGDQIRQIEQVAFAQAEGECAPEFVDSLISDFVGSGVEVVDRPEPKQRTKRSTRSTVTARHAAARDARTGRRSPLYSHGC